MLQKFQGKWSIALDKLKLIKKTILSTDFSIFRLTCKVSLKILNSGIILKTFTHPMHLSHIRKSTIQTSMQSYTVGLCLNFSLGLHQLPYCVHANSERIICAGLSEPGLLADPKSTEIWCADPYSHG